MRPALLAGAARRDVHTFIPPTPPPPAKEPPLRCFCGRFMGALTHGFIKLCARCWAKEVVKSQRRAEFDALLEEDWGAAWDQLPDAPEPVLRPDLSIRYARLEADGDRNHYE